MQIKELEMAVHNAKTEQEALQKELDEARTKDVSRDFVDDLAEKTEKRISSMNVLGEEENASKLDLRINELEASITKLNAEKADLADQILKLNDLLEKSNEGKVDESAIEKRIADAVKEEATR